MPCILFLVFGIALHNVKPELKALQYKEDVLLKAVDALLSLTDADGEFFPLNDAQKGMSYRSSELVTAVNIAYYYGGRNPQLLSVAQTQGKVLLDQTGLAVAQDIDSGKAEPFLKHSVNLTDGAEGAQGGIAVLRAGQEDLTAVFKYAAQGLSHGHYDKLSISMFDRGEEVLQDYGLVRFVNIGQKGGGNYLPENATWAKQSIAHNTLVINEQSHFGGDYETGSQHHSELYFFDADNPTIQIVSAFEENAYPGTRKQRTVALITGKRFREPFLLDLWHVDAGREQQYDLPFYYMGQMLEASFPYETAAALIPLGEGNGYQHLHLEATGEPGAGSASFSWLGPNGFYTLTTVTEDSDEILLARVGANDPGFNLRRDPVLILRRPGAASTAFATVIEPHGSYSPVTELALESRSEIAAIEIAHNDPDYTVVAIVDLEGVRSLFAMANRDASSDVQHSIDVAGQSLAWRGPFHFFEAE